MKLTVLVREVLGEDLSIAVCTWDGERVGPADALATIVVRSADAVARLLRAPGQLGLARAYVAGDLDVEGDIFAVLAAGEALRGARPSVAQWAKLARVAGRNWLRRPPVPADEARLRGRRHGPARDRAAISYHYDVSNDFYQAILGPSMTYSCALFADPTVSLETAQTAKHELVCRKLGLAPGHRLLDVGCGWGAMVRHAARHHDAEAVGVTLSAAQSEWADKAVVEDDLADRVAVRFGDYRDVADGPFDAISSVGMSEHVGAAQLSVYFEHLFGLLAPGGRLLNHAISSFPAVRSARWPSPIPIRRRPAGFARDSFIDRYVFPDGELVEVGTVVSAMQGAGFEVRHVESLREHYGLTLRRWVANLETGWDTAVAAAGLTRARTWRLYLAGSAWAFETGRIGVHQVLAVKPDQGRSGLPLRPTFV